MPKGKKKSKSGGLLHSKLELKIPTSEDESIADNCSVISNLSEFKNCSDDDTGKICANFRLSYIFSSYQNLAQKMAILIVDNEEDVITSDDFEEKLREAIDGTLQKSVKGRQTCLETVRKALCSKCLCEFISDRKVTMIDMIERSLKRGRGDEQSIAAVLSALICVQLGSTDESELIFQSLHPTLSVILTDPTALPNVRAQCATSLGLCCFISCAGSEVIDSTMEALQSVFCASFFKGNGVAPVHKPEICSLHSSALNAWSLLLTVLTPPYIMNLENSLFRRIPELLESTDLELRITAGETIAVFYELAQQCHNGFLRRHDIKELCDKLRHLAMDGQKFRAKKDRRQQRSSFRDVLKAIEEEEAPDIRIKFGKEVLYIDTWCRKRQYDAFCQLLGSGMNYHLSTNELMRDIFELGSLSSLDFDLSLKRSKFERNIANIASSKARTKSRNKLREKKANVFR